MDDSPLRRSLFWLTTVRIVVLVMILLSAILVQAGSGAEVAISYLYGLCAAAVILSAFHWTLGRLLPTRAEAYLQILGDLGLVCVLVYSSGGLSSVFTFLYLVVIGAAAFLLYRTGALVIASAAALLHGLMVELTAYEVLPRPALAPVPHWSGERVGYNLAITVAGFYGVAFMLSYLSEKLRGAREELGERQKALSRIQTLYANVIASMSSGLVTADSRERVTFLNQAGGDILGIVPARAVGKQLAEIGLVLPSDWGEIRQRTRGREGFRAEIDIERGASRRVIGYSRARPQGSGRAGRRAHRFPGPHRGEEARTAGALQRAARGRRRARRRNRARDPQSARVDLRLGPGPLARALGRLGRAAPDGDHRLRVEPPLQDPGGVPALRPPAGAPRRAVRRRGEHPGGPGPLPAVGRGVRRAIASRPTSVPPSRCSSGDRDQIRQIIYNVAKNAVRAMPEGGTLTVEGREDGAWYSIKFRDTGRGMSDEELARIFTPFSTAFDGGTGLGMAIVRRIVEDHGGAIDVESTPGEGTTVTVLLPRDANARVTPERTAPSPEAVQ